jgi:hypothetical protein
VKPLPKVHVALVEIPNVKDPESIALAGAHAALELLLKVSADERGAVVLDRVAIVKPTSTFSRSAALDLVDLLAPVDVERGSAVMVTCRVTEPKEPSA